MKLANHIGGVMRLGALLTFVLSTISYPVSAQQCCAQPQGMTNWYKFDKASPLLDQTGGNNLTGSVTTVTGEVMDAENFAGTAAGVLTASNANQPSFGAGDFSFDAWIKVAAVDSAVEVLVEKRQASPLLRGWSFYTYKGALGVQIAAAGQNWNYGSSVQIPLNTWVFVAVVVHRSITPPVVEFYQGGSQVAQAAITPAAAVSANVNNTAAMKLGSRTISNDGFFKGQLDEVELFNRALTAAEIKSIFAAGPAGKCVACKGIDVLISGVKVPNPATIGKDMQYNIVQQNAGTQASGPVEFQVWLDKNSSCTVPVWTVGQTSNSNIPGMTSIPSAASYGLYVPPGNYFLCWKTDPNNKIAECPTGGEANNLTVTPVTLSAACSGADLEIAQLFPQATTVDHTKPFGYVVWVFNEGSAAAGASTTKVYLDSGSNHYLIDTIGPSPAASGMFQQQGLRTASITSVPPGSYTLRAVADANTQVTECNEANNTLSSPTVITVQ